MKFARKVLCVFDYEEESVRYWTAGKTYGAKKCRDDNWSIETDQNTVGKVGKDYLADFDEFFCELQKDPKKAIWYTKHSYARMQAGSVVMDASLGSFWRVSSTDGETIVLKNLRSNMQMDVNDKNTEMNFMLVKTA